MEIRNAQNDTGIFGRRLSMQYSSVVECWFDSRSPHFACRSGTRVRTEHDVRVEFVSPDRGAIRFVPNGQARLVREYRWLLTGFKDSWKVS